MSRGAAAERIRDHAPTDSPEEPNRGDYDYYRGKLSGSVLQERVSYANLFSNDNWRFLNARFLAALSTSGREVVLVTHHDKDFRRASALLPYNRVQPISISTGHWDRPVPNPAGEGHYVGGCTAWYCAERDAVRERFHDLALSLNNAVFLIQAGPLGALLAWHMFQANRGNCYLDMGHSLDPMLFGDPCRGYMIGEPAAACHDMDVDWQLPGGGPTTRQYQTPE